MDFLDSKPEPFETVHYQCEFASEIQAKNPVIDRTLDFLRENEYLTGGEDDLMNIRLVLEEAIVNAIRHGNEYDPDKTVVYSLGESEEMWGVTIEDQGGGFAKEDLPDPDDPAAIFSEGGRGVFLMEYFMDKVAYFGRGTGVLLMKRKFTSTAGEEETGEKQ